MGRKFFVGGNWKMNGSNELVHTLVGSLRDQPAWAAESTDVVIAPPSVYLAAAQDALAKGENKGNVQVSSQNIHTELKGAYTGEVSVSFLKDLKISWTILGHSERRQLFGESDEFIAKKSKTAIDNGVSVIGCIGETEKQREDGETFAVLERQVDAYLKVLGSDEAVWSKFVIAYEPVWAIGTGKVATTEQAQEVHAHLRKYVANKISKSVAEGIRIIYGGSVNAANFKALGDQTDIDGFLVGGASLKAQDFLNITSYSA